MPKTKTIVLIEPITGHGDEGTAPITQLTFREPRYADLIQFGELNAYARSEDGLLFSSEKDDVIRSYINRLLIEPKDPALLNQLCLADGLMVKELVHDFFGTAREQISKRGPVTSSST